MQLKERIAAKSFGSKEIESKAVRYVRPDLVLMRSLIYSTFFRLNTFQFGFTLSPWFGYIWCIEAVNHNRSYCIDHVLIYWSGPTLQWRWVDNQNAKSVSAFCDDPKLSFSVWRIVIWCFIFILRQHGGTSGVEPIGSIDEDNFDVSCTGLQTVLICMPVFSYLLFISARHLFSVYFEFHS